MSFYGHIMDSSTVVLSLILTNASGSLVGSVKGNVQFSYSTSATGIGTPISKRTNTSAKDTSYTTIATTALGLSHGFLYYFNVDVSNISPSNYKCQIQTPSDASISSFTSSTPSSTSIPLHWQGTYYGVNLSYKLATDGDASYNNLQTILGTFQYSVTGLHSDTSYSFKIVPFNTSLELKTPCTIAAKTDYAPIITKFYQSSIASTSAVLMFEGSYNMIKLQQSIDNGFSNEPVFFKNYKQGSCPNSINLASLQPYVQYTLTLIPYSTLGNRGTPAVTTLQTLTGMTTFGPGMVTTNSIVLNFSGNYRTVDIYRGSTTIDGSYILLVSNIVNGSKSYTDSVPGLLSYTNYFYYAQPYGIPSVSTPVYGSPSVSTPVYGIKSPKISIYTDYKALIVNTQVVLTANANTLHVTASGGTSIVDPIYHPYWNSLSIAIFNGKQGNLGSSINVGVFTGSLISVDICSCIQYTILPNSWYQLFITPLSLYSTSGTTIIIPCICTSSTITSFGVTISSIASNTITLTWDGSFSYWGLWTYGGSVVQGFLTPTTMTPMIPLDGSVLHTQNIDTTGITGWTEFAIMSYNQNGEQGKISDRIAFPIILNYSLSGTTFIWSGAYTYVSIQSSSDNITWTPMQNIFSSSQQLYVCSLNLNYRVIPYITSGSSTVAGQPSGSVFIPQITTQGLVSVDTNAIIFNWSGNFDGVVISYMTTIPTTATPTAAWTFLYKTTPSSPSHYSYTFGSKDVNNFSPQTRTYYFNIVPYISNAKSAAGSNAPASGISSNIKLGSLYNPIITGAYLSSSIVSVLDSNSLAVYYKGTFDCAYYQFGSSSDSVSVSLPTLLDGGRTNGQFTYTDPVTLANYFQIVPVYRNSNSDGSTTEIQGIPSNIINWPTVSILNVTNINATNNTLTLCNSGNFYLASGEYTNAVGEALFHTSTSLLPNSTYTVTKTDVPGLNVSGTALTYNLMPYAQAYVTSSDPPYLYPGVLSTVSAYNPVINSINIKLVDTSHVTVSWTGTYNSAKVQYCSNSVTGIFGDICSNIANSITSYTVNVATNNADSMTGYYRVVPQNVQSNGSGDGIPSSVVYNPTISSFNITAIDTSSITLTWNGVYDNVIIKVRTNLNAGFIAVPLGDNDYVSGSNIIKISKINTGAAASVSIYPQTSCYYFQIIPCMGTTQGLTSGTIFNPIITSLSVSPISQISVSGIPIMIDGSFTKANIYVYQTTSPSSISPGITINSSSSLILNAANTSGIVWKPNTSYSVYSVAYTLNGIPTPQFGFQSIKTLGTVSPFSAGTIDSSSVQLNIIGAFDKLSISSNPIGTTPPSTTFQYNSANIYTISNLSSNTSYNFTVTPIVTELSSGSPLQYDLCSTSVVSLFTSTTLPTISTFTNDITRLDSSYVTLNCSGTYSTVSVFSVDSSALGNAGSGGTPVINYSSSKTGIQIPNLLPNITYYYYIVPYNSVNASGIPSIVIQSLKTLGIINGVSPGTIDSSSVQLNISGGFDKISISTTLSGGGGGPIGSPSTFQYNPTNKYSIANLSSNSSYNFTVTPIVTESSGGLSWDVSSSFGTFIPSFTSTTLPTISTFINDITRLDSSYVTLNCSGTYSTVSVFSVASSALLGNAGSGGSPVINYSSSKTGIQIPNLLPYTIYYYYIVPYNSVNASGIPSIVISASTLGTHPTLSSSSQSQSFNSVAITVSGGTYSNLEIITYNNSDCSSNHIVNDASYTSAYLAGNNFIQKITGLSPNQTYWIKATPFTGGGTPSIVSNTLQITTYGYLTSYSLGSTSSITTSMIPLTLSGTYSSVQVQYTVSGSTTAYSSTQSAMITTGTNLNVSGLLVNTGYQFYATPINSNGGLLTNSSGGWGVISDHSAVTLASITSTSIGYTGDVSGQLIFGGNFTSVSIKDNSNINILSYGSSSITTGSDISGLIPMTTYSFSFVPYNTINVSNTQITPLTFTTLPKVTVSNNLIQDNSSLTVTYKWSGTGTVATYGNVIVSWHPSGGSYSTPNTLTSTNVVNNNYGTAVITNLSANLLYYYKVVPYSNGISGYTVGDFSNTTLPTINLSTTNSIFIGDVSSQIFFTGSYYSVDISGNGNSGFFKTYYSNLGPLTSSGSTLTDISNLTALTQYTFTLTAKNTAFVAALPAISKTFTTLPKVSVSNLLQDSSSLTINYGYTGITGVATYNSVVVWWYPSGGGSYTQSNTLISNSATTAVITNLSANVLYYCQVVPYSILNAGGTSGYPVGPYSTTTLATISSSAVPIIGDISARIFFQGSFYSVNISGGVSSGNGGIGASFYKTYSSGGAAGVVVNGNTSTDISNLLPNFQYNFTMTPMNSAGINSSPVQVTFTTLPKITSFSTPWVATDTSALSLTWDGSFTGVNIKYGITSGIYTTSQNIVGSMTKNTIITGLTSSTKYYFVITPSGSGGVVGYTYATEISGSTLTNLSGITVNPGTDASSLVVGALYPTATGLPTSYDISCSNGYTSYGVGLPITIQGLNANTFYTVYVTPYNPNHIAGVRLLSGGNFTNPASLNPQSSLVTYKLYTLSGIGLNTDVSAIITIPLLPSVVNYMTVGGGGGGGAASATGIVTIGSGPGGGAGGSITIGSFSNASGGGIYKITAGMGGLGGKFTTSNNWSAGNAGNPSTLYSVINGINTILASASGGMTGGNVTVGTGIAGGFGTTVISGGTGGNSITSPTSVNIVQVGQPYSGLVNISGNMGIYPFLSIGGNSGNLTAYGSGGSESSSSNVIINGQDSTGSGGGGTLSNIPGGTRTADVSGGQGGSGVVYVFFDI